MSRRLALYLLGAPKVELDNAPVTADRRKTLALLAYLAVNRWEHHRDHISALLWPDYDQAKAYANLRHILWEIQQAIGEGWIAASRDTIGLSPKAAKHSSSPAGSERLIWVDVAHFQSLIAEIRARAQRDVSLRVALLADSVTLYRDHFLSGFSLKDAPHFNEWASAQSENLRYQLAYALATLSEDYGSLGQAETAIPYARRLVTLDPFNEAFHRQLMQVYFQAGQHNAALKQYQVCEQILRKELGVDPQPETRLLYKQIRQGGIKPLRPVKQKQTGIGAPGHNLPFQISSFIGREKELDDIANLIANHRLVTLIGPGGIGKTRLSLKVAEGVLKDYPDGIWLVELASLNDPARVPQTVGTLFNLIEGSDESPTEKLIRVLRPRTLLLLFDNCEHLLDACAHLADRLLKHCPNLKILVTSREALGITGEALYHVPSLGLPDLQQALGRLLEYESIELFEERARLVQEDFSLTIGNASSIAQICHRLDGIPLAIELAAARVDMFSTAQIAARLNEGFNLLTGGSRTALPRQQTLRASIDWSWNLLSEPEQALLRRLAVFAGGWTLEGAEAVGAGLHAMDVPALVGNLAEKSLVSLISESDRYRMLETIREYALERLKDADEEEATRNRHLDFYVAMAERGEPKLLGKEQGLWMKKLSEEQENLIAAIDWSKHSQSRIERGFQLLGGTRYYWAYAGLAELGYKMYREALARSVEGANTLAQGLTLDGAAIYAIMLGDPSLPEHIEKSISIFQAQEDYVRLAMALSRKALWHVSLGNHPEAIKLYHEAIAIGRRTEDKRPISSALNNLAELYRLDEAYEKATPLYEQALGIDRERDDSTGIILGLVNLSRNTLMQGSLDQVRSQLSEAARIVEEEHLIDYGQSILETLAVLRFALGEHLQGARLFGTAEMELKKKGYQRTQPDEEFTSSWTTEMRETLGEETFSKAIVEGGKLSYEAAMAETRKWLQEKQE